jgi:hypothetical protein
MGLQCTIHGQTRSILLTSRHYGNVNILGDFFQKILALNFTRAIIYFASPALGSFKILLLEKGTYISTGIVPFIISLEMTIV